VKLKKKTLVTNLILFSYIARRFDWIFPSKNFLHGVEFPGTTIEDHKHLFSMLPKTPRRPHPTQNISIFPEQQWQQQEVIATSLNP
jgi:hypothetical protein